MVRAGTTGKTNQHLHTLGARLKPASHAVSIPRFVQISQRHSIDDRLMINALRARNSPALHLVVFIDQAYLIEIPHV